jgi:hypothetical protein
MTKIWPKSLQFYYPAIFNPYEVIVIKGTEPDCHLGIKKAKPEILLKTIMNHYRQRKYFSLPKYEEKRGNTHF